ncbi:hypothetical protein HHI36_012681 [Cryptolaemus montrouzieri]|uniref:FLYWCH-type domain-containing protein n=1 Tax=Cryptolaemus montrouzieri TaxID=559131 RepID=A0ABD2NFL6_9CUCU
MKLFSENIYIERGTKNPKIILDRSSFIINRKKTDRTLWICSKYRRTNCKARLVTFGRNVKLTYGHNHSPDVTNEMLKSMIPQKAHIIRCYVTCNEKHVCRS